MKHQIGVMQGRLTHSNGRGIQFFPFDNWENEFYIAQQLGLDEIEFIFDFDNYENNPLWTVEGIEKIKKLQSETHVRINAVCFDYFMRRPFYKADRNGQSKLKKENTQIVKKILLAMNTLGIKLLEIPLVDDASLSNRFEKDIFREWLLEIVNNDDSTLIALETDLESKTFLEYLKEFDNPQVGANYDSGNSSGLGYDLYEEVTTLKDYIFNIHIKDRIYKGSTVPLGTGSANFEKLFQGLKKIGYQYNFILQAARGEDGREKETISVQMEFVRHYINKYNV